MAVVLATVALSRLEPRRPHGAARRGSRIDSVRQGDVVREVRGPGTLVPEQIRFITAQASARVERKSVESGDKVGAGQVLLEMSNPDLQIQTMQAEQQVRQAQIELLNLKTNLRSAILTQEGVVAQTRTTYISATQEAQAADSLQRRNLISTFEAANRKAHQRGHDALSRGARAARTAEGGDRFADRDAVGSGPAARGDRRPAAQPARIAQRARGRRAAGSESATRPVVSRGTGSAGACSRAA